jgi:hypothetical protein
MMIIPCDLLDISVGAIFDGLGMQEDGE